MKIYIISNGCPRRMLDSSKLARYFTLNKCQIVNEPQIADYIVFITCSFIKEKEEECWRYIEKFGKYKGELIIIGCLPEIVPIKFAKEFKGKYISTKNLNKIDTIFDKFDIKFSNITDTGTPYSNPLPITELLAKIYSKFFNLFALKRNSFYRIFISVKKRIMVGIKQKNMEGKYVWLRISNGCIENCSYCCIVNAIGRLSSKTIKSCVEEYTNFLHKGFRKFVILGDNTGAYGLDMNSSFEDLLENLYVASGKHNVAWHLEQIHPRWILRYKTEILKMVKEKKIRKISCSIQSGSNRILKLMNRHHTIEELADTLLLFKKYNPDLKLRTEIIVGFPSETEGDFSATLDAIKKIQFNFVYVYPYYDGYGTIASKLDGKVAPEIIGKRLIAANNFLVQEGMTESDYDW